MINKAPHRKTDLVEMPMPSEGVRLEYRHIRDPVEQNTFLGKRARPFAT